MVEVFFGLRDSYAGKPYNNNFSGFAGLLLDTNAVISLLRGEAEIAKIVKTADGYRRQGIGENKRD